MLDELDSNGLGHGNPRGRNDESSRPLSDREVPIGSPRPAMAAALFRFPGKDQENPAENHAPTARVPKNAGWSEPRQAAHFQAD